MIFLAMPHRQRNARMGSATEFVIAIIPIDIQYLTHPALIFHLL